MPIYEYECGSCGIQTEITHKISDPPMKTCEKCGRDSLQRLISRTAFTLKGGGWYSDLYSSTKPKSGSSDSASSTPAASSAPAASTTSTAST